MRKIVYMTIRLIPLIVFLLCTRGCADASLHAMGDDTTTVDSGRLTVNSNDKTDTTDSAGNVAFTLPGGVVISVGNVPNKVKKIKKAVAKIQEAVNEVLSDVNAEESPGNSGAAENSVEVTSEADDSNQMAVNSEGQNEAAEPSTVSRSSSAESDYIDAGPVSQEEEAAEAEVVTLTEEDEYLLSEPVAGAKGVGKTGSGKSMAKEALSYIGVPYVTGGVSPDTGFDCSGLAYYIYRTNGYDIPRTAFEQFKSGEPVDREGLKQGDLVFFQVYGDGNIAPAFVMNKITEYVKTRPTHIGIYIGNGKFVHSPRPGKAVKLSTLESNFWGKHFIGARRYVTN